MTQRDWIQSEKTLRRRDFLVAGGIGIGAITTGSEAATRQSDRGENTDRLALFPLDPRCALLSNVLWTKDSRGEPTLSQQHLWVRLPSSITVSGAHLVPVAALGPVRFETSPDEGISWRLLAQALVSAAAHEEQVHWQPSNIDNIRVVVNSAPNAYFPFGDYFSQLNLLTDTSALQTPPPPDFKPLSAAVVLSGRQPVAGDDSLRIHEHNGLCHQPPLTNRLNVTSGSETVCMQSPLMNIAFSRELALVRSLGWDIGQRSRQNHNLLSAYNTQGAFPVVGRACRRMSSDVGGGELTASARAVSYRKIRVVPELEQSLEFSVRENGFTLTIESNCARTFRTSEFAALRLPFDLYQCVTSVLAIPETIGPSGLVRFPLVIHAPNHGTMRVTLTKSSGAQAVLARVMPFRVQAELWLDLIVGARPLENGLFEIPQGRSYAVLEFQLIKVFPFANTSIFTHWERPPFYSFVDRETILGALPNEWLSGIPFRPEMGRFANNSVSEPIPIASAYHGEMAAYTPQIAPGLTGADLLRCAADSLLRDFTISAFAFTDFTVFPQTLASPIDLAWLSVGSTGDWHWAAQRRFELKEWANRLLSREYRQTGLIFADSSGNPGEGRGAMWLDSIRSGHLESYVTAFCARAALRASELLGHIGDDSTAEKMRALYRRAQSNYWKTFYDPNRRRVSIWVDRQGKRHDFDSHAHLGAAIVCGFAPKNLAATLLREYLGRLRRSGFGNYEYGVPIMLEPIPAICHNDWFGKGVERDGADAFGVYQNGSICHFQLYYLFQALYQTGLRKEANALWSKITPRLRQGGSGISGPLHSGVDWRTPDGNPSGYEGLLAEQHHFMLAAITGYLGLELSIDGLRSNPSAVAATSDRLRSLHPNFARLAARPGS